MRYDLKDPGDFQMLLDNGHIWKISPEAFEKARAAVVKNPSLINVYTPDTVVQEAQAGQEVDPWAS